jgi:hypothetical protein
VAGSCALANVDVVAAWIKPEDRSDISTVAVLIGGWREASAGKFEKLKPDLLRVAVPIITKDGDGLELAVQMSAEKVATSVHHIVDEHCSSLPKILERKFTYSAPPLAGSLFSAA